jgi:N-terminal domain of toast_rack, DUF2154/Domain of unknown function (DUF5668)
MAPDSAPRRASLFFPILLIALGIFFLYAERHPDFDPWPVLSTYWPLILIFLGLAKIWDSARRRQNPAAPSGPSFGGIVAAIALVFIFAVLIHSGRFGRWHTGTVYAMQHSDHTVDRDDAKTVNARIQMNAGDLDLSGGATHLLEADFDYRASSGVPKVDYSISGVTGDLNIYQDNSVGSHFNSTGDNHWTLHMANDVPIELRIDMGAGRGNLRLRDIDISRFNLSIGAGQVNLDLTGDRKQDLIATVEGGVGEADIRLPKNVGVVVNASGGLGTIDTRGLHRDGDEYVNDAYGKSQATIHLKVSGGIGRISLSEE